MTTTLQLDEMLLKNAVKLGQHKTAEEAVNKALKDYVTFFLNSRTLYLCLV